MSHTSDTTNWTKPSAMAIPPEGYFKLEQGRYGVIFPKTPACYGFTIIAKIIPGRKDEFNKFAKRIEQLVEDDPTCLEILKLHYLRWVIFDLANEPHFMYQAIFDTDFDKYTEDAVALFTKYGINTAFENLVGFPKDWKVNTEAFIRFVHEHQFPSFLEYGEYPFVSADEIKKSFLTKDLMSEMLDQMQ